jgi:hypothetical protein
MWRGGKPQGAHTMKTLTVVTNVLTAAMVVAFVLQFSAI